MNEWKLYPYLRLYTNKEFYNKYVGYINKYTTHITDDILEI